YRLLPFVPLTTVALRTLPAQTKDGENLAWEVLRPVGPVPLELADVYPAGSYLAPEEFDTRPKSEGVAEALVGLDVDREKDWSGEWTRRQVDALITWRYGPTAAAALLPLGLLGRRSPKTGRLRRVERDGTILFHVGTDGLVRPTWRGAQLLHTTLPSPESRVVVGRDAVPFVREGRSLFSRFVVGGDLTLVPGASALLVDTDDALLAVGRLVLAPGEMGRLRRGVAVRVTGHEKGEEAAEPEEEPAPDPGSL
ncbi:MAG: hypothetical protein L3K01_08950, partial [Thermoplasmata archaeon]|nr:hypothetical protein [Thermoplasmata archaeon]